jgi:excisionase family DNA binding protein
MQAAMEKTQRERPPLDQTLKRALSVREFNHRYGFGKTTTYAMIAAGTLPSVLIGGRRLIPVDAAEALLSVKK